MSDDSALEQRYAAGESNLQCNAASTGQQAQVDTIGERIEATIAVKIRRLATAAHCTDRLRVNPVRAVCHQRQKDLVAILSPKKSCDFPSEDIPTEVIIEIDVARNIEVVRKPGLRFLAERCCTYEFSYSNVIHLLSM